MSKVFNKNRILKNVLPISNVDYKNTPALGTVLAILDFGHLPGT